MKEANHAGRYIPKVILTLHPLVQSRIQNLWRQRLARQKSPILTAQTTGPLLTAQTTRPLVWLGPWWLAGVDSFWTLQVCWLTGIEVICPWSLGFMHLTSGVVGVVRVHRSFKSGVHERRWPTQADEKWYPLKHRCPGQGVSLESCAATSERKVSQHACVWFQR